MMPLRPVIFAVIALSLSASALAKAPAAKHPPTPEEARVALNRAQAEAAQQQVGENRTSEENHAAATKRQQEAYAASVAAYAAQKAQYEADLARWRATLPPCRPSKGHPCPAT